MTTPAELFDLRGRTALVTGARREIGRAIALALAGAGARIAVHHAGEAEAAEAGQVVAEIEAMGVGAESFGQDFSRDDAGTQLAEQVTRAMGGVDILVLNASIELPEPFAGIDRDRFDRQVAVNLRSTMELLQGLVPGMAERGWGRVVAIGSIQQERPHPRMFVYAGSKAMQWNWMRNLAQLYGASGVTANNLAPGVIATARNREQLATEGEALRNRIPVRRFGRPDDLAGAALLLCSDAGAFINGANLAVDGGGIGL